MSLITDHKVTYRSEAFISEVATACRKLGTPPGSNYVNLQTILDELQAHGVESIYRIRGVAIKGTPTIEIIDDDPHDFSAFVKFSPRLTLHVQRSIWSRYMEGQSAERVIIAHEIGHIMLHSDEAKPFVGAANPETKFIEEGHYAEWQADTFADHLLVPTELAQRLDDPDKIAFAANVPERLAMRRLANVQKIKKVLNLTSGEPCPGCGNFTLVESRNSRKCSLCGFSGLLRMLEHVPT